MKTILIITLSLVALNGYGQVLAIWRGNCPGHEREWNYPGNWSSNAVPDEFSDVVIPLDVSADAHYPVISGSMAEINSLHIWPGAVLVIEKGKVEILDIEKSVFRRHQVIGNGIINYRGDEDVPDYLANNKPDQKH